MVFSPNLAACHLQCLPWEGFFCTVHIWRKEKRESEGSELRAKSPALWLFSEFSQAFYPSDLSFCQSPHTLWVWDRMDTFICMVESLRYSPETNTTLLIGNSPIQNVFGVNNNNKSPRLCLSPLQNLPEIDLWSFPGSDPSLLSLR